MSASWAGKRIAFGSSSTSTGSMLVFLGASYATLAVGGAFTRIDSWYADLAKPSWTPPGLVIGIVWWILYTLIGGAAAIAWETNRQRLDGRILVAVLSINLLLNAAWSFLFFTRHDVAWALADIVLLWISTFALVAGAGRRSPLAAALLTPYLLWVAFAAFLNYEIWRLNY